MVNAVAIPSRRCLIEIPTQLMHYGECQRHQWVEYQSPVRGSHKHSNLPARVGDEGLCFMQAPRVIYRELWVSATGYFWEWRKQP